MPSASRSVSESVREAGLGSLSGCLVEADAEQRSRQRRVHRCALMVSVLSQAAILATLLLVPLFGKPERILAKECVPIPPYGRVRSVVHERGQGNPNPKPADPFGLLNPYAGRPRLRQSTIGEPTVEGSPELESSPSPFPLCAWCVPGDRNAAPRPPEPSEETHDKPPIVHFTHLDPALLTYRVEPVYPPLAIQTHREGRVELRAIIATDGSIQSLEIVAGDPIFCMSAKEAVRQWRYKPTVLNGQPVEVDTRITVIYSMPR